MFKLLTQDAPKVKFNLDLNQDISDIHLEFYENLDKNIQEIKRITFEEISDLVNTGMHSETSYYKFNANLSVKKQISEITADLDEAVAFLKEDVRELRGNSFEVEKKKLTITRIQNIKKEIKSVESSLLNKSFKEIMKRYSVSGVLGYRDALIFLYTFIELYGIKDEEMFEYCVIDEAQDLCVLEMAIISKFVTNNRFCIIGDLNQNIHNNPLSTWEEIFPIFRGSKISTFQLDTNYRSTRNIIEFSNKILSSFTKLYLPKSIEKFGPEVEIIDSSSSEERLNTFTNLIKDDFSDLKKSVGVVFYNFEEYEKYLSVLQQMADNPEKLIILSESKKAVYSPRVVYATDFSNCKGLEFNKVYLFGFNSNKLKDFVEAKKFFVGATRAMNELVIFN
jgi:DNA helicase-2/ATP-dependent DNA helicase PcrA